MSKHPSHPMTLLTFWAAGNVSLAPFLQVTCAETAAASQRSKLSRRRWAPVPAAHVFRGR